MVASGAGLGRAGSARVTRTSGGVRRELWTVQWSTTASSARRRFSSSGWGRRSRKVMVSTRAGREPPGVGGGAGGQAGREQLGGGGGLVGPAVGRWLVAEQLVAADLELE